MSTQLPAEWQQKIREKAFDYLKRRFDGQQSTTPSILDDSPDTHFAAGYAACVAELLEAQGRIKTLEAALNNIVYPIKYLQDKANLEGAQIDGIYAMQLSKDAEFLKGIAKNALTGDNKLKEDE